MKGFESRIPIHVGKIDLIETRIRAPPVSAFKIVESEEESCENKVLPTKEGVCG